MIHVKPPRPKLYIPNSGTVSIQNPSSALVREHELFILQNVNTPMGRVQLSLRKCVWYVW